MTTRDVGGDDRAREVGEGSQRDGAYVMCFSDARRRLPSLSRLSKLHFVHVHLRPASVVLSLGWNAVALGFEITKDLCLTLRCTT